MRPEAGLGGRGHFRDAVAKLPIRQGVLSIMGDVSAVLGGRASGRGNSASRWPLQLRLDDAQRQRQGCVHTIARIRYFL